MSIVAFWFRRDLRLEDNHGLYHALKSGKKVLPVFIFDTNILDELADNDARVNFIYEQLSELNTSIAEYGGSILIKKGKPVDIWAELIETYNISSIFSNHDYEPYGIQRDSRVTVLCEHKGILFHTYKDLVIFERSEIVKQNETPYTVFTPYKKRWLQTLSASHTNTFDSKSLLKNILDLQLPFPKQNTFGFHTSKIKVRPFDLSVIAEYDIYRNLPYEDRGTYLSPHLRFGTVSIRQMVKIGVSKNDSFLSELIWREFFMQILYHYPLSVNHSFRKKYDNIEWLNNEKDFEAWKGGKTGYPFVDAGMRQLNETGYMHNRVRMVTASFLCKHLLIDWRWGESYFANKLLDYELSSNNGNWQWAAGSGCDAAPYFRVFNPLQQQKKFDPEFKYIRKWIPEFNTSAYPQPIIEHRLARLRVLKTYKNALKDLI